MQGGTATDGRTFVTHIPCDSDVVLRGVGLGLAISRELAVGMNGTLSVSSVAGEGTTLTLPTGSAL